jgi:hypothetical protein
MMLAPPCDGRLGPVHVLGLRWPEGIHLRFIPKVVPFVLLQSGEDVVQLDDGWEVVVTSVWLLGSQPMLVVLLIFSRLLWWRARELTSVQL